MTICGDLTISVIPVVILNENDYAVQKANTVFNSAWKVTSAG